MKFVLPAILLMLLPGLLSGQNDTSIHKSDTASGRVYLLQKVNRNGEVLPEVNIKEVTVLGRPTRESRLWLRKYDRLTYNLKKVYPYALLVRVKLAQVNDTLTMYANDRERRKYLKDFEKRVFKDYEADIREMTITQGKLLIKLIDRETQNTSFDLIKQYRGGLTAAFWQGIARIFGTNLKEEYDPYGDDILIEMIVTDIEAGRL